MSILVSRDLSRIGCRESIIFTGWTATQGVKGCKVWWIAVSSPYQEAAAPVPTAFFCSCKATNTSAETLSILLTTCFSKKLRTLIADASSQATNSKLKHVTTVSCLPAWSYRLSTTSEVTSLPVRTTTLSLPLSILVITWSMSYRPSGPHKNEDSPINFVKVITKVPYLQQRVFGLGELFVWRWLEIIGVEAAVSLDKWLNAAEMF